MYIKTINIFLSKKLFSLKKPIKNYNYKYIFKDNYETIPFCYNNRMV